MATDSATASAARREFSEILARRGHAVDNARDAIAALDAAFAGGVLVRNEEIDEALVDLRMALEMGEGQKLGGKSAEAARFIGRRLERLLEDA